MLNAFHLKAQDLDSWTDDDMAGFGALKYLNSGVYMGRVKDLKPMYVEWMRTRKNPDASISDQGWLAQVLQDRPDLVALDYASMIVSNLFGVRFEKGGQPLFSFQREQKQWMNTVTGKPVCFFHGNGAYNSDHLTQDFDNLQQVTGKEIQKHQTRANPIERSINPVGKNIKVHRPLL